MTRIRCAVAVVVMLSAAGTALAQEAGPGRVEIGVATGGGALFLATTENTSSLQAYSVGGTITVNLRTHVGIEGDLGFSVGHRQDQLVLVNQATPKFLNYNGSLIYSPIGIHHRVAPFVAAGLGAMTVFDAPGTDLGLTQTRTFLTGNTGGGVNWFPTLHIGVRGDYRFMVIRNQDHAPIFFAQDATRFAHRICGALLLTY